MDRTSSANKDWIGYFSHHPQCILPGAEDLVSSGSRKKLDTISMPLKFTFWYRYLYHIPWKSDAPRERENERVLGGSWGGIQLYKPSNLTHHVVSLYRTLLHRPSHTHTQRLFSLCTTSRRQNPANGELANPPTDQPTVHQTALFKTLNGHNARLKMVKH